MATRPVGQVTASLTAQNTFTDPLEIRGDADLSASGITDSTVTVQRSFDGTIWKDVEQFTADFEKMVTGSEQGVAYRIGIKTGDYGSDTVVCEISK